MKKIKLIAMLEQFGEDDTDIMAFDADSGNDEPITGVLYDPTFNVLILQTDDNT
jgi:hypothetical protein